MTGNLYSWTIINDEIDFAKDIINYHLDNKIFGKMYFLDTGSEDGTWEYLQSLTDPRIIVERYHIPYRPDYSKRWEEMLNPFPESVVRNWAIGRCKQLCNPKSGDFLVQLDADEIFLPKIKEIVNKYPNAATISHSTINPCCALDFHPKEKRWGADRQFLTLFDPHCRIWGADKNISYIKNYELKDCEFHCVPVYDGKKPHVFETLGNIFVPDLFHFHLHYFFGTKLFNFYANKGINNLDEIKKHNSLNEVSNFVPEMFLKRREEWYSKIKEIK